MRLLVHNLGSSLSEIQNWLLNTEEDKEKLKRQTTVVWQVAVWTSKGAQREGLSWTVAEWVTSAPAHQSRKSLCRGLGRVQLYIQARWSQQNLTLKAVYLEWQLVWE